MENDLKVKKFSSKENIMKSNNEETAIMEIPAMEKGMIPFFEFDGNIQFYSVFDYEGR
jgi:hypothetical protein